MLDMAPTAATGIAQKRIMRVMIIVVTAFLKNRDIEDIPRLFHITSSGLIPMYLGFVPQGSDVAKI